MGLFLHICWNIMTVFMKKNVQIFMAWMLSSPSITKIGRYFFLRKQVKPQIVNEALGLRQTSCMRKFIMGIISPKVPMAIPLTTVR
jgi:hypothetical protein